ncbi:MAG: regulatory protein [Gammaproteobacteria bacterium]|nr:regulatory protein [Gammaproteobacteria bacterium]
MIAGLQFNVLSLKMNFYFNAKLNNHKKGNHMHLAPTAASSSSSSSSSSQRKTPIVISCFTHKGGVGKTTAAFNLGYCLSHDFGLRVLLVDGDSQCSLTSLIEAKRFTTPDAHGIENGMELFYESHEKTAREKEKATNNADTVRSNMEQIFNPLLKENVPLSNDVAHQVAITPVQTYKGLYYIPGHLSTSELDQNNELGFSLGGLYAPIPGSMTNIFRRVGELNDIDIILFDLSPNLGGFNKAVLLGSDYFTTPFFPEYLSHSALRSLGSALPKWVERYRNSPQAVFSKLPGIGHLSCAPKFLGGFGQRIDARVNQKLTGITGLERMFYREPIATHRHWLEIIGTDIDLLRVNLAKYGLIESHFEPIAIHGVQDFHSAGIDAQAEGIPICDTERATHHPTSSGSAGPESAATFLNRVMTHHQYRYIAAKLLSNMSAADLLFLRLRQPRLAGLIAVCLSAFRGYSVQVSPAAAASASSAKPAAKLVLKFADAHHYNHDEINELTWHYIKDIPGVSMCAPIHIKEVSLEHALTTYRQTRLGPDISSFFIPLALGDIDYADGSKGGHWVMLYGIRSANGQLQLSYFDPFGNDPSASFTETCKKIFGVSGLLKMGNVKLQQDGYNCGPWVIEAIRRLSIGEALPNPEENFDINAARAAQQAILQQAHAHAAAASSHGKAKASASSASASAIEASARYPLRSGASSAAAGAEEERTVGSKQKRPNEVATLFVAQAYKKAKPNSLKGADL